ncbi:TetR/AcrR family transcriptional regulator [Lysinibacillus sp. 54212]|uniref:TetR/AcrR family transcriptional regulator n=1 Tax=Lysinibacillus sp. 54212 TaxID=3119829 RepID=UPI002FCC0F34
MPRGRRVNSSGEKSKKLLLEKAIELFSTHGYHQTKISDIVKAANLTQPTFYLYFQSKESLFNDLNEEFQNKLMEIMDDGLLQSSQQTKNIKARLFENFKNIFNYFVENPNLTKIGFYECEGSSIIKNKMVYALSSALEREQSNFTVLDSVGATILAESILGSVERLTLTTLLTKQCEPEKLASHIINIYFTEQLELV